MIVNGCNAYAGENAGAVQNETLEKRATISRSKANSGEILGALVEALGKVKKLTRSDRNDTEGYTFSSIDSFLSLVNPICAETGLVVLMDETSVEDVSVAARSGTEPWLRVSYEITLAHVSGQMLGPFRRHVDVPRSGPQAYGAAQSYVLKQFLRAQFQIATGESDDPDFGMRSTDRNGSAQRAATSRPGSKKDQDPPMALDAGVVDQLARRVVGARSGRELLAILAGLSDECVAEEALIIARLAALRRIVASAASLAALDKLEHHFSTDWPKVSAVADRRRSVLLLAANQTEKTTSVAMLPALKDPTDRSLENAVSPGSDQPAFLMSETQTSDDNDFGEIPYNEAAA